MTVSINTKTQVATFGVASRKTGNKSVPDPTQLVTDHYLLDQYGKVGRKAHAVGPANKKIQPEVVKKFNLRLKATSGKLQAASLNMNTIKQYNIS